MNESDRRPRPTVAGLEAASRRVVATGVEIADEGDRWLAVVLGGARDVGRRIQRSVGTAKEAAVLRVAPHRADGPRGRRLRAARWILGEADRAGLALEPTDAAALADKLTILLELVLAGEIDVSQIDFERAEPPPPAYAATYPAYVAADMDGPLAGEGER